MNKRFFRTTVVLVMPVMVACNSSLDRSKARSLDNIESGDLKFHECRAQVLSPSQIPAEASNLPDSTVVDSALKAIPQRLLDMYFSKEQFAGAISIEKDIKNVCWPRTDAPARADDGLGCNEKTDQRDPSFIIHLASVADGQVTKAQQAYALVLRFGIMYTDVVLSRQIPVSGPVYWTSPINGLQGSQVEALAIQFLTDVYERLSKSSDPGSLKSFARAVAFLGVPEALATSSDLSQRMSLWRAQSVGVREGFATRVLAEAFHSYYCNLETHEQFVRDYPLSFRIFEENFAKDLNGSQQVQKSFPIKNLTSSSRVSGWYALNGTNIQSRLQRKEGVGHAELRKLAGQIRNEQLVRKQSFGLGGGLFDWLFNFLFGGFGGLGNLFGGGGMGNLGGLGYMGGGGFSGGGVPSNNLNNLNGGGMNPVPPINQPGGGTGNWGGSSDHETNVAFDAGNQYRIQHGLPALTWSPKLVGECTQQAQAQEQQQIMKHCLVPGAACGNAGAENIAMGQRSGKEVATDWYNSPGHRANLLNGSMQLSGIGRVGNSWCQRFE